MNERRLIARGSGNWDYYLTVLSDGKKVVESIAKPGTGCNNNIWCGVNGLKAHLHHLANVRHGANWITLIPEGWEVVDRSFFEALGIC